MAVFPLNLLNLKTRNGHAVAIPPIGDTVNDINIILNRTLRAPSGEVLEAGHLARAQAGCCHTLAEQLERLLLVLDFDLRVDLSFGQSAPPRRLLDRIHARHAALLQRRDFFGDRRFRLPHLAAQRSYQ